MAHPSFIDLFDSKEKAFSERFSPDQFLYEWKGIHLIPNQTYPYRQTTTQGVELEDYQALIVDCFSGEKTEITAFFQVEKIFNDSSGVPQITWSITNIPFDFGFKMIYLEVTQLIGATYFSNPFVLTEDEEEMTVRVDYKDSLYEKASSVQLRIWFRQELRQTELESYYEISTKNTVTVQYDQKKYERWISDIIANSLALKISEVFDNKFVYFDLTRVFPFKAFETKVFVGNENFSENIYELTFNKYEYFNPNEVIPVPEPPSLVITNVIYNGVQVQFIFTTSNFTPSFLVYEWSQDQATWTKTTAGSTSPQSFSFQNFGTWYFRISHPLTVSNVFELNISATVQAFDDNVTVQKGQSIQFNPLGNDVITGVTTITSVGTPSNGTADISGNFITYTHDNSASTSDSFTYTISNGSTSDSATVYVTVTANAGTSTAFSIGDGSPSAETACGFLLLLTKYHNGSGASPVLNDFVFEDSAQTTVFVGDDLYFPIANGRAIRINNLGRVTDVWICGQGSIYI